MSDSSAMFHIDNKLRDREREGGGRINYDDVTQYEQNYLSRSENGPIEIKFTHIRILYFAAL